MPMQYFTFRAGGKLLLISTSNIEMIISSKYVLPLFQMPRPIRGVLEVNKELVAVLDFNELITGRACAEKMHSRVAVVQQGIQKLGILGEYGTNLMECDQPLDVKGEGVYPYIHSAVLFENIHVLLIDVPVLFKTFHTVIDLQDNYGK